MNQKVHVHCSCGNISEMVQDRVGYHTPLTECDIWAIK